MNLLAILEGVKITDEGLIQEIHAVFDILHKKREESRVMDPNLNSSLNFEVLTYGERQDDLMLELKLPKRQLCVFWNEAGRDNGWTVLDLRTHPVTYEQGNISDILKDTFTFRRFLDEFFKG